ncbi:DedA family protein [Corynebacterium kozikiae]|uniref:DedA family protein n=1 Tax=Corynebacterium kozikiae TaxID=2968469 RepID=UPI00211C24A5|nr:DedA family protein [Corynebacterium sp. 76QC2CO]MCQ9344155.1 DedA family protein [Corynebacterium sp. 76QC2CO]
MTSFIQMLTDVQALIGAYGLIGLALVVFAETGLLIGFFLPGDSLLFAAGMLSASTQPFAPLWAVMFTVGVAAFVGDQTGYIIGRKFGPLALQGWAGRKIGPERIARAEEFFATRGTIAVFLGRFIPVIRTVVPVLAGVNKMDHRKFVFINAVGALVWGCGVPVVGYLLGEVPFVQHNFEVIVLSIVAVSVLPLVVEFFKGRKARPAATAPALATE